MAKTETIDSKLKKQVELVTKGAELIKNAIRLVYSMHMCAKMEPEDMITSTVLATGHMVVAYADSMGAPREEVLKLYVHCLEEYVTTAEKKSSDN